MFLKIIPLIVASILLGAHFLRELNYLLAVVCILMPLLLLIKKRWGLLLLQVFTYAGGVIWVDTIITIARRRITYGEPWSRMAVILGAVALFTVFSGLLLNSQRVKKNYR
jgi:hypothetical protein